MIKKLRDLLLYMGLNKENYQNVKGDIAESNRRSVMIFSVISLIGFLIMSVFALLNIGNLGVSLPMYGFAFAAMTAILLLNYFFGKKYPALPNVCSYLFMALLLAAGTVIATVDNPENLAASYLAFMMGLPALFCVTPAGYACLIAASNIVINILFTRIQSGDVLLSNRENTVIYGIVSIVIAASLMKMKASKFKSDRMTAFLLEKDRLTGIYNRRSYEIQLEEIKNASTRCAVAMFDVNGLKKTNDTIGHRAGDELIRGTAQCIEAVFGKYGKCYRIGGDEFAAVMENLTVPPEEVIAEFNRQTQAWRGELVSSLNVSCGIATAADIHRINTEELINLADKRMYEAKTAYYSQHCNDRRRR